MVCDCFRRLSRGRRGGIGVNSGVNFGVNNVVDSGVNSGVNFGVNSLSTMVSPLTCRRSPLRTPGWRRGHRSSRGLAWGEPRRGPRRPIRRIPAHHPHGGHNKAKPCYKLEARAKSRGTMRGGNAKACSCTLMIQAALYASDSFSFTHTNHNCRRSKAIRGHALHVFI